MWQIVVLEPAPRRGPELRLELADVAVDIYSVSKASQLEERVRGDAATVIVWDTAADLSAMLSWLGQRLLTERRIPVVACASPATADLEWTCRGLGVVSWSNEHVPGHKLARLCRDCASSTL